MNKREYTKENYLKNGNKTQNNNQDGWLVVN